MAPLVSTVECGPGEVLKWMINIWSQHKLEN